MLLSVGYLTVSVHFLRKVPEFSDMKFGIFILIVSSSSYISGTIEKSLTELCLMDSNFQFPFIFLAKVALIEMKFNIQIYNNNVMVKFNVIRLSHFDRVMRLGFYSINLQLEVPFIFFGEFPREGMVHTSLVIIFLHFSVYLSKLRYSCVIFRCWLQMISEQTKIWHFVIQYYSINISLLFMNRNNANNFLQ